MAKIATYPVVTPTVDDLLIGTNGADGATRNFSVGAIVALATEADLLLAPLARTLTINGTALDLSADRVWTVGDVLLGAANIFTLGPNVFRAGADGNVALAARRFSSGATANIFEAQDESGGGVVSIAASGNTTMKGGKLAISDIPSFTPPYRPAPTLSVIAPLAVYSSADITTLSDPSTTVFVNFYSSPSFDPLSSVTTNIFNAYLDVYLKGTAKNYSNVVGMTNSIHYRSTGTATQLSAQSSTVYNSNGGIISTAVGLITAVQSDSPTPASVTTAIAIQADVTFTSGNSGTTGSAVQGRMILAAGSTLTTYTVFRGRTSNINAGATIANAYGLWIDKMVGGSTIQRAILTDGGTVEFKTGTATIIGQIIKGFTAQSANLQEWQDVNSVIHGTISENGYFTTRKVAAPADAELATSEVAFWFDDTAGAAKLMIKAKNASGTVVTGNVALS